MENENTGAVSKKIGDLEFTLLGKVKRVFERDSDCYAAFTEFFHFRDDLYNYIVLEYNAKTDRYALEFGMWYDHLKEYVSKLKLKRLTSEKLTEILSEIKEGF